MKNEYPRGPEGTEERKYVQWREERQCNEMQQEITSPRKLRPMLASYMQQRVTQVCTSKNTSESYSNFSVLMILATAHATAAVGGINIRSRFRNRLRNESPERQRRTWETQRGQC